MIDEYLPYLRFLESLAREGEGELLRDDMIAFMSSAGWDTAVRQGRVPQDPSELFGAGPNGDPVPRDVHIERLRLICCVLLGDFTEAIAQHDRRSRTAAQVPPSDDRDDPYDAARSLITDIQWTIPARKRRPAPDGRTPYLFQTVHPWWFPSLLHLAERLDEETGTARRVADRFRSAAPHLTYAVVEEMTDDHVGLTLSPWPIVDAQDQALLWPITRDPAHADVPLDSFQEWADASRRAWAQMGLLRARERTVADSLVTRPVTFGDVFALVVEFGTTAGSPVELPACLHPIGARRKQGTRLLTGIGPGIPAIDVTWDARQAARLAHYGTAGTVRVQDRPEDARLADDLVNAPDEVSQYELSAARALVALERRVPPEDVTFDEALEARRR